MLIKECKKAFSDGSHDGMLKNLYGEENVSPQRERYIDAIENFEALYGSERGVSVFSVPGRSEISGNHTDHNHGCVIAAAINLDIIAVASKSGGDTIRVKSKDFPEDIVSLKNIKADKSKYYESSELIAGICHGFNERGREYGAFDAYTTSDVLKGSGLSSSAAFEVMIGNILNHLYNGGTASAPEIAGTAQYAENVFFGKPCGLMDQTACAVGGFVTIDFKDPVAPVIEKLDFDLTAQGYKLCMVNTGGNHADLNEDYASIPGEMKKIAAYFGQEYLRGLKTEDIIDHIGELRRAAGDRAVLRALHFIEENDRVKTQIGNLRSGNLNAFLDEINNSGDSSYKKLQNAFTVKNVNEQGISLALAIAGYILRGKKSACRVHGGGFAGTIQAFIPEDAVEPFTALFNKIFGDGSCVILNVRASGAVKVV